MDKVVQVVFHPTAKDLLTVVAIRSIHLFDLGTGEQKLRYPIESEGGAYNICWNPSGDRMAMALKDHHICVVNPRDPSSAIHGPAHDSPRSFQITWLDNTHLISVGFARGSSRKINLYEITPNEIKTISSYMIDTSPSVLFPIYDPDTNVLHVWGKGERQIQLYEIHPEHKTEPIVKLSTFTASAPQLGVAFWPKRLVDVKQVEVAKALRVTAKVIRTIEEVSFSIPRNKASQVFRDQMFAPNACTARVLPGRNFHRHARY